MGGSVVSFISDEFLFPSAFNFKNLMSQNMRDVTEDEMVQQQSSTSDMESENRRGWSIDNEIEPMVWQITSFFE